MRRVYYDQDATMVHYYADVLEGEGMRVMKKNVLAQLAAGEVPFQQVYPEVWVMDDGDYERAVALIREMRDGAGEVDFSGVDFDAPGEERGGSAGGPNLGRIFLWCVFGAMAVGLTIILWDVLVSLLVEYFTDRY